MKKIACMLLALVMIMTLCASFSFAEEKQDGFKVALSTAVWGNTWSAAYVKDFEEAAEAYKAEGLISEYQVVTSPSDLQKQVNDCTALINKGIDALIIWPVSAEGIRPIVDLALENDVLVIIGNDAAAYEGTYGVFSDNDAFMRIISEWFVNELGGKGDIVQIAGVFGHPANEPRQAVVDEVLANYPDINTLAIGEGKYSTTDAQAAMSVFLSTYPEIDGVLTQDVMSVGILNAYKNAGIEPKVVTGDYTKEFIDMWASMPDLSSVTVTVSPGIVKDELGIALRLLQGKTFKEGVLKPNPADETLVNAYITAPAYVVTRDGDKDADYLKNYPTTQAISLEEAVELVKDMENTDCLDGWMSAEALDSLFE